MAELEKEVREAADNKLFFVFDTRLRVITRKLNIRG